jgi:hypothetical protein
VPLSSQGCASPFEGNVLAVVGENNAQSFRRTPDAAEDLCEVHPTQPSSANTRIRFYTCEQRPTAGEMLIRHIALRLTPTPDWPLHGYIYTISLRCHPTDCREYEPLLLEIVASVRFR